MEDIPLEYFLPLPQANTDGEILGERKLSTEIAQALHALQISDEQLKELRSRHLQRLRLQHKELLKRYKGTKKKVLTCLRKARSRQSEYPDNVERLQKRRDKLETFIRSSTKYYRDQEQEARNWFPPYYKNGKYDAKALEHTLHHFLSNLIPSLVQEVAWRDENGQFIPIPSTPKIRPEKLKQDDIFWAFATDLYQSFLYWCPSQRKEAKVFADTLSPLQHSWRLRYNKQAENLTVAVINHAVPNLRYTPSDLRYLYLPTRVELPMEKRLTASTSEPLNHHLPTNAPSHELEEIRRNGYQASLFDPFAL